MKTKKPSANRMESFGGKENKIELRDRIHTDVLKQFQMKKTIWQEEAKKKEIEKRQAQMAKKKEQEKNKTFEELLNESPLNWREFK